MWTKNGSETLPLVLRRIGKVIPSEAVNQRIIVDDHSTDNTREIAESFGWNVIFNEGKGISDGANTALKRVKSDYFASFEQDLLLSYNWWNKIPPLLENPKAAVASGVRFANEPSGVQKLQQYVAKKYRGESKLEPWLRSRQMAAFTLGKTLDNTIYKTKAIRALGGFPKTRTGSGIDTILAYKVNQAGYQWIVDYEVQSIHLRRSLKQELLHQYWHAKQLQEVWSIIKKETNQSPPLTRADVLIRFMASLFTGVFIALKTKEPSITYIHPLIRFYYLKGFLEFSK